MATTSIPRAQRREAAIGSDGNAQAKKCATFRDERQHLGRRIRPVYFLDQQLIRTQASHVPRWFARRVRGVGTQRRAREDRAMVRGIPPDGEVADAGGVRNDERVRVPREGERPQRFARQSANQEAGSQIPKKESLAAAGRQ